MGAFISLETSMFMQISAQAKIWTLIPPQVVAEEADMIVWSTEGKFSFGTLANSR